MLRNSTSAPLLPNGLLSAAFVGRVLVACEYSGTVREAFTKKGWDAVSCDILPTEKPGKHKIGDVRDILMDGWDLLIAFPPCTFLTYAGMASWYDEGRAEKRIEAARFFMEMYNAPIPLVCVENPRGIMSKIFRSPDMVVHPYYFGEREMKRTCLWLKGLPPLEYHLEDNLFGKRTASDKPVPTQLQMKKKTGQIKKRYWTDATNNGNFMNGKKKSKFFQSVADAMAEQWTAFVLGSR